MISFEKFVLANGLQVVVHEDHSVPIAVMDVIYDVGSRDESPEKTGFAHLFEHLMFGGSKHIPEYDSPLQNVGGNNNAFTSPDMTNYYLTLPAANLETGFWLESDRMLSLSFDPAVLEVQRKVVIEEFKQRYLNQPYGDAWLKLRPLAYQAHPYRWATIGKDISHIEQATLDDVKAFFHRFYCPNNAVLVVGGHVTFDQVKALSEKWFGPIAPGPAQHRNLPRESRQTARRTETVMAKVPSPAIYMAFHSCAKNDPAYHASDLLADVLGRGKSSRLYQALVKDRKMFSNVHAYLTGSFDPGLLVVSGRLNPGFSAADGEAAVFEEVNSLLKAGIHDSELQKVKNQAESSLVFSEMEVLNRCINLAQAALLGNPNLVNLESRLIQAVDTDSLMAQANNMLKPENCSVLSYEPLSA